MAALPLPLLSTILIAGLSGLASADIEVRFYESAPKDRFVITNTGGCDTGPFELEVDLTSSIGALIFDTTGAGAGVEVFQPFEIARGRMELVTGTVRDGDRRLKLRFFQLAPRAEAAFTIDVDDTLQESELGQIRVVGGEMAGSRLHLQREGRDVLTGTFSRRNLAVLELSDCGS